MRFLHVCVLLRLCLEYFLICRQKFKNLYLFHVVEEKTQVLACPFASAKKLSKRKKDSISFDKDRADLAASDRGSYFEQKKYLYRSRQGRALMGERDRSC